MESKLEYFGPKNETNSITRIRVRKTLKHTPNFKVCYWYSPFPVRIATDISTVHWLRKIIQSVRLRVVVKETKHSPIWHFSLFVRQRQYMNAKYTATKNHSGINIECLACHLSKGLTNWTENGIIVKQTRTAQPTRVIKFCLFHWLPVTFVHPRPSRIQIVTPRGNLVHGDSAN